MRWHATLLSMRYSTDTARGDRPTAMPASLPARSTMLKAFAERDSSYEGIFYTAVQTTGIFCRPTCSARKPKPENVEFFPTRREALLAGYRPCKRCRPLAESTTPEWAERLLAEVEADPARRWRDRDLRQMELEPATVRRWFQANLGLTFHSYSRARRLTAAMGHLRQGEPVIDAAFGSGFESLSGFADALEKLTGRAPSDSRDLQPTLAARLSTPLGTMLAAATDEAIVLLEFTDRRMLPRQLATVTRRLDTVLVPGTSPLLGELQAQLHAYMHGRLREFDLPVNAPGTPFQETVWSALTKIPVGETRSYSEIAESIGRPTASRAVARANGDNRIAILIPCHRVVAADGSLSGYGGGVWRKRRLLEIEGGGIGG